MLRAPAPAFNSDAGGVGKVVCGHVLRQPGSVRRQFCPKSRLEVSSERVGMREVAGFCHVGTVAASYCAKSLVQSELGQSLLGSNSIDFGKN